MHTPGELVSASPTGDVWRVGRKPAPWGWSDWKWADGGAFPGRWDSPNRTYRTSYAGSSAYASLVEVLAHFRPDPAVVQGIADMVDDEVDALYPTAPAGVVHQLGFATDSWLVQPCPGSSVTSRRRGLWRASGRSSSNSP